MEEIKELYGPGGGKQFVAIEQIRESLCTVFVAVSIEKNKTHVKIQDSCLTWNI